VVEKERGWKGRRMNKVETKVVGRVDGGVSGGNGKMLIHIGRVIRR